MRRSALAGVVACVVACVVAGCQAVFPGPVVDEPVIPLSKVNVHNASDRGIHVRMNWPDGFVQVAVVAAGETSGLSGAIGTSGFPATIDILDSECELLQTLSGLPAGSAGIVIVANTGASLQPISEADRDWTVASSVDECGATPVG